MLGEVNKLQEMMLRHALITFCYTQPGIYTSSFNKPNQAFIQAVLLISVFEQRLSFRIFL